MGARILYVERKPSHAVSIEKVFRQIAKKLAEKKYVVVFQQLAYANGFFDTVKNLLFFKKSEADIYHVTGHVHYIALLLPREKTVLTVHDAGILHIREGLRRWVLKKLLFDLPLKKLKYVTAVSETTKQELIRYTNCDGQKIRVIENPLQEHFFCETKKDFDRELPVILQIGTTANKNLPRLIAALEKISCRLKIVGELSEELTELLKEKKINYVNRVNLSNEEIKLEYAGADILAFCSTFEGFGLPIIEAQAMRTPVLTSGISPLKEVAGGGAAFADPESPESIRVNLLKIIEDAPYRAAIVAGGIENVKRFRAENITALYEDLYREILADSGGERG